jgi:hypothetical protein
MGRTLEVYNITIASAKSGQTPKNTLIPGTSASGELFVDRAKQLAIVPAPASGGSGTGNGQ